MVTTWSPHRDDRVLNHELYDNSFWRSLVIEAAESAAKGSADDFERGNNIRRGLHVVEAAAQAVSPDWWDREKGRALKGWYHRSTPLLAGKKHGDPYIIRLDVERAAAAYLKLPYRVDALDRLLTDMLMAAEMFAFADEVQPQLKQKLPTVLAWAWGNLKSLIIGLSIAGVILWFAPSSTAAQWAAGIIAGLTLLGAALSLVVFPFLYPSISAQRKRFVGTVKAVVEAYTTLGGSPASVPHIRKMVERATDAGVVWPAPLMALLDDIAERRKAI